ncbi:MAG: hypothetical protein Q9181_005953 [Wetmoreana brouardii]
MDLTTLSHLELPATADFHCHLRQDEMMEFVTPYIEKGGVDAVFVMPNLQPPITQVSQALSYHQALSKLAPNVKFLMSLFLHASLNADVIAEAARSGVVYGVTTNSQNGVLDIEQYYPVFEAMQKHDLVLNLHGETPGVSVLGAESTFVTQTLPLLHSKFPDLRIVLEHTPADRIALLKAAADGSGKFFFGSDSAPHHVKSKEQASGAAGCFTQGWCTALVIGAMENGIRQGWISKNDVTYKALEGFLSGHGRAFYQLSGLCAHGTKRGNEGLETVSMSAAKYEADPGPEISAENTESDLNSGDEGEEQGANEDGVQEGAGTVLEDEEETPSLVATGTEHHNHERDDQLEGSNLPSPSAVGERPSSADGSLSIPDDTPSIQGSVTSSASRQARLAAYGRSPTPSLRPFDRRFQARISQSPQSSSRAASPAFLHSHSRQVSTNSQLLPKDEDSETEQTPWEVIRWTRLRKISGQAFSEVGKRNFGRPVCIAISTSIAMGTSKGIILIFDYNQNLKSIIGPGTKAVESGAVTSICLSADHTTIAGGHTSGHVFTWELAKPAKPFLHIPPVDRRRTPDADGHIFDVAILHLGFLGKRHTALVSADDKGMAFSHLATRGMGAVARSVKTTRVLGRYPELTPSATPQRKPSSVLAFSPLPLGNAEHVADNMGLVAMLTPYLLVIVSTTPIAQTQYKTPRPKEVAAHSTMSAALAWFPSVKLKIPDQTTSETSSRVKLVYCWSNILTVLEVTEVEPSATSGGVEGPPNLRFRSRSKWKAQEAIVAVQWLGRSVLAVLTITQQLIILEEYSLRETNHSELIQKHIYHADLFSQQLNMLVEQLDEEDASMHGVVADAFYMSFRAYKGRLFLLGFNEVTFGQLSNWADRLLALVEEGNHIRAIELATSYYTGEADKVSVGLPEDDSSRHGIVRGKLLDLVSASLRYTFGKRDSPELQPLSLAQFQDLARVCICACISIDDTEYLFEDVYTWFSENNYRGICPEADTRDIFLDTLESYIMNDDVGVVPPTVIKDLVSYYMANGRSQSRLEEILCHLDPKTMDIDQITGLCKRDHLYDALLYVWNQALEDYTTILNDLLNLAGARPNSSADMEPSAQARNISSASKMFPYLSYILTSRIYPTGKTMDERRATLAKAEIYHFFFSGSSSGIPNGAYAVQSSKRYIDSSFPNLQKVLDFDAPSFLSMLNEAFEDSFLNGAHDDITKETSSQLTDAQKFGLSVNRQWIVCILLELMVAPRYEPEDTVYLNMFIARNLPKFPQYVLMPGHLLHRVLIGLCEYPVDDVAEDCQLSVEYLLSVYQPPDVQSLVPLLSKAGFFRVLRSIFRSENEYAKLVQTCFDEGPTNGNLVFECVTESLRTDAGLSEKQADDVREVIRKNADRFVDRDVKEAAATIEKYSPSLHGVMLKALDDASDDERQLSYLQTILDPSEESIGGDRPSLKNHNKTFVELYVRLLCEHDPLHVAEYVERLKTGDLRLEEVMPSLESSGVIDAAVVLMAREGEVRAAMDRLTQHLDALEAALLGLLDAAADSPDVANTSEAVHDLVGSIQKFTRIGIWLCQGETRSAQQRKSKLKQVRRAKEEDEELSINETLWLDLIDAVVKAAKQVTEILQPYPDSTEPDDRDGGEKPQEQPFNTSKIIGELRTIVQEAFTALLSATSGPRANESLGADVSFLRILRAFLSRASVSSPSLSNLRSVLSSIFSAYSYEERLLGLANRLLDKDLFIHVAEAETLRRRGWRPLGQVCEGCGKRVWGPGTGGHVWEAYQQREAEAAKKTQQRHGSQGVDDATSRRPPHGKGKAVQEDSRRGSVDQAPRKKGEEGTATGRKDDESRLDVGNGGSGALIVFSCRHLFHRICLEKMQGPDDAARNGRHGATTDRKDFMDDPTNGTVKYVDQDTAQELGMLDSQDNGAITLRSDSTSVASGRGRNSLRLTSKTAYNHALIVIDLAHMPGNACGIWPAFWTVGPSWPYDGEIDIIEGVNLQSQNQMTMHTSDGCSLAGSSCLANKGCPAKGGAYGDEFNRNNGGTYAMEWTSSGINIWFFARGQEPGDVLGDSPEPKNWGDPTGKFDGGDNCDIDSHFKDQKIVFDTTFCGDWAGNTWSSDPVCSAKAATCEEFVQNNPKAFEEAFWTIKALKVYSANGGESEPAQETQQLSPNPVISSAAAATVQQPSSQPLPIASASMVTFFVDGGPVTATIDQGAIITQVITGEPVTMTLAPGSPPPAPQQQQQWAQPESLKDGSGGGGGGSSWSKSWSWSSSSSPSENQGQGQWQRRRRGRGHLVEHLRKGEHA